MSARRFFIGSGLTGVAAGAAVELPGGAAYHARRVLRLRAGDPVAVFGEGREFRGRIEECGARVRVLLLEELPPEDPHPAVTLCPSLIRPSRFDWLIEKGTELGVSAFIPLITEHTAVRAAEAGPARRERWQRIALEATEQSLRRTSPLIHPVQKFDAALARAPGRIVLAWEGLRAGPTAAELAALRESTREGCSLFVGPEGGFAEGEVARAAAAGAFLLGLGPRTLRSETAAIVALSLLLLG